MNDKKVFCYECRKDVSYTVTEANLEAALKGEKYCYTGQTAYCADCGEEIYVADINDSNLKSLYDVYRKRHGIISLENILAIPDKYAIGKRPLSLLLGWGEQTFSRYCDGDMPTKVYSERLQNIYDDPNYYLQILESNKSNLKSDSAYEKSRKAVDSLLENNCGINRKSKIYSAIDYLLNQCEDVTPLALQKALYYIQGFCYAFYNTFFFNNDCEAWVHGPVYRDIYSKYRDYRFDSIEKPAEFNISVFSSSEKAILDSVIKNFCCYSGKVLEKFTHLETPWVQTRGDLPPNVFQIRLSIKKL